MFHWENGLKLTSIDLAIDFRRRQPRAFVSHAHSDHMARHEFALHPGNRGPRTNSAWGRGRRTRCLIASRSIGPACG